MSVPKKNLELLDVGSYADLSSRPNPENLTLGFFPSLVSNLLAEERKQGRELTESEVLAVRDISAVAAVPGDRAVLEEAQGYRDVHPENCWEEWQEQRLQLLDY